MDALNRLLEGIMMMSFDSSESLQRMRYSLLKFAVNTLKMAYLTTLPTAAMTALAVQTRSAATQIPHLTGTG